MGRRELPKAGGSVATPHWTRPGAGMLMGTGKWKKGYSKAQNQTQADLDRIPPEC